VEAHKVVSLTHHKQDCLRPEDLSAAEELGRLTIITDIMSIATVSVGPAIAWEVPVLRHTNKTNSVDLKPASELYRLRDLRLSAKLVSTFVDRGCCVVSTTNPYGHILDFLDGTATFSFK
jgi:hypothetical protein